MRKGFWGVSPQPISIGKDGRLLDGQHRLTAVVITNIPLKTVVAYDVPDDAIIDKGMERSLGDSLYMRGMISKKMSSNQSIAIVNDYLDRWKNGLVSDDEKMAFIQEYEELICRAFEISTLSARKKQQICRRAPIQSAILGALICGVDEKELENFCRVANSGFMNSKTESAAIVLRNAVLNTSFHTSRTQYSDYLRKTAQMAIKDFVAGVPRVRQYSNLKNIYLKQ